ncbi:hypothetical protein THOG11_160111 [Vibrio harveyi]|nr:hypothetical protein TH15OA1_210033 [Vibrio harveyi]CAH1529292.1 hypothetical protein VHARVF571_220034 [Vibrio harveyi]CAH1552146.1 hypothetical protein THOD03_160110 [Vibrio harveyi]CAH1558170.1 hypothetical protein THOG11_160111 [Vibrio harveyi]
MSHLCDEKADTLIQTQERTSIDYDKAQTFTPFFFTDSNYQCNISNYHRTCYSPFCLKFQRSGAGG